MANSIVNYNKNSIESCHKISIKLDSTTEPTDNQTQPTKLANKAS